MRIALLAVFVVLIGCNTDDKTIDVVDENIEYGAVIRTLEVINTELNINDLNSAIHIDIEEQDVENGALFSQLDVYVQFLDRTPENGSNSLAEMLLEERQPDVFSAGPSPDAYPRSTLQYSFSQLLDAMKLTPEQVSVKDQFILRMDLRLTDGRSFTKGTAISDILAFGSFFSSPYEYTVTVVDPIAADQFIGTYRITSEVDG